MEESNKTFEDKIKSFVETLEVAEAEQFLKLLEINENIQKEDISKITEIPQHIPEVADMTKPIVPELKRSYIIESLPGNKMRIIEDYGS